ncbi:MAG: peptidase M23, partial [uncultured bacterium]
MINNNRFVMKKNKKIKKLTVILSFLVIMAFIGVSSFVFADESKEELEKKVQDRQDKVEEIQDKIRGYTIDIAKLEKVAQTLEIKVKVSESEMEVTKLAVEGTQMEVERTEAQIKITKQQVEQKEKELQYEREVLASLLRKIRKNDKTPVLTYFLRSTSFSKLLNLQEYTLNYQEDAQDTYVKVKELKGELVAKENDLEKKKEEQQTLKQQLEVQHSELSRQKRDSEELLNKTQKNEEKYQELIGEAAGEQKKLAQEIADLEKEIMAKNQADSRVTGPPVTGSGVFIYPTKGGVGAVTQGYGLTSYAATGVYGYNEDGSPRIHAGVDFGDACGTAVMAAADGEVTATGNLKYG